MTVLYVLATAVTVYQATDSDSGDGRRLHVCTGYRVRWTKDTCGACDNIGAVTLSPLLARHHARCRSIEVLLRS